jgi:formamidopyrimidine-DNA glycosylase
VTPLSSSGCRRCCSYGSAEQRAAAAETLAKFIDLGRQERATEEVVQRNRQLSNSAALTGHDFILGANGLVVGCTCGLACSTAGFSAHQSEIVGKKIKSVEADGMRAVRRHHNRKQFANRLIGKKIVGVQRRGKYLLCRLDGDDVLVIHLGMSGQLLRKKTAREPMSKHTHVVITFTQGGQLRFVDPRTFGEMFVTEIDNVEKQVAELAHLGIDPLETAMSWEHFGNLLAQRHAKLKPLLMDQKFIAGIGNIYSDEILWGAGLRWDRMSDSLTAQEVRRLYRAMMETLQEAVKHRGSSLADEQYVDLFGRPGEFQQFHNVYAREGEACPRCRHVVVRERFAGRSTFYCDACQV